MTPADILATTLAAAAAIYVIYRIIMRHAGRVIDGLRDPTIFED